MSMCVQEYKDPDVKLNEAKQEVQVKQGIDAIPLKIVKSLKKPV